MTRTQERLCITVRARLMTVRIRQISAPAPHFHTCGKLEGNSWQWASRIHYDFHRQTKREDGRNGHFSQCFDRPRGKDTESKYQNLSCTILVKRKTYIRRVSSCTLKACHSLLQLYTKSPQFTISFSRKINIGQNQDWDYKNHYLSSCLHIQVPIEHDRTRDGGGGRQKPPQILWSPLENKDTSWQNCTSIDCSSILLSYPQRLFSAGKIYNLSLKWL